MDSNFNSRVFDEALRIVVKEHIKQDLDEYNKVTEAEKHVFSPEFEARMGKVLKRGEKFKDGISRKIASLKVLKRTAIIVLIILSVSFVSLLSVEAIRTEISNIITTFFERFIDIRYDDAGNPNFMLKRIEEIFLPAYIPYGYVKAEVFKSELNIIAVYVDDDENEVIYFFQNLLSAAIAIDGEDFIEHDIVINGFSGKIYEYNKPDDNFFIVVWNDYRYFYQLSSPLSKEETIKIAESVRLYYVVE